MSEASSGAVRPTNYTNPEARRTDLVLAVFIAAVLAWGVSGAPFPVGPQLALGVAAAGLLYIAVRPVSGAVLPGGEVELSTPFYTRTLLAGRFRSHWLSRPRTRRGLLWVQAGWLPILYRPGEFSDGGGLAAAVRALHEAARPADGPAAVDVSTDVQGEGPVLPDTADPRAEQAGEPASLPWDATPGNPEPIPWDEPASGGDPGHSEGESRGRRPPGDAGPTVPERPERGETPARGGRPGDGEPATPAAGPVPPAQRGGDSADRMAANFAADSASSD